MTMQKLAMALLAALLAVLPQLLPWTAVMLTIGLSTAFAVIGIGILLRAGQVSFGHGMYFAAGAYAVTFMTIKGYGFDAVMLIGVGGVAALALAATVGLFVVRYRYIFFSMITLAMSMIAFSLLDKLYSLTGGSDGLNVVRPTFLGLPLERSSFEMALFYLALTLCLGTAYIVRRYTESPIGAALSAIKSNETRLEYIGVSSRQILYVAYCVSAFLTGVGGALMALITGHVAPEFTYWVRSGEFVFIAIFGGIGSIWGAVVGSIAFEAVRNTAAMFAADYWQIIVGTTLLLVILFMPRGLAGIASRLVPVRLDPNSSIQCGPSDGVTSTKHAPDPARSLG